MTHERNQESKNILGQIKSSMCMSCWEYSEYNTRIIKSSNQSRLSMEPLGVDRLLRAPASTKSSHHDGASSTSVWQSMLYV